MKCVVLNLVRNLELILQNNFFIPPAAYVKHGN
jgi:hypothetical protein